VIAPFLMFGIFKKHALGPSSVFPLEGFFSPGFLFHAPPVFFFPAFFSSSP